MSQASFFKVLGPCPFSEIGEVAYCRRFLKVKNAARRAAPYLLDDNTEGPEQSSTWLGIGAHKLGLAGQEMTGKDLVALPGGRKLPRDFLGQE